MVGRLNFFPTIGPEDQQGGMAKPSLPNLKRRFYPTSYLPNVQRKQKEDSPGCADGAA